MDETDRMDVMPTNGGGQGSFRRPRGACHRVGVALGIGLGLLLGLVPVAAPVGGETSPTSSFARTRIVHTAERDAVSRVATPDVVARSVWGPPRTLTATAAHRRVTLRWSGPDAPGSTPITSYVVQRFDRAGGVWTHVIQTPPGVTEVVVDRLRNGSKQRFRVATSSLMGVGAFATVTVSLPSVIDISAGQSHTCAVAPQGRVLCWGDDSHGQLGSGGTGSATEPRPVRGLGEVSAVAVATGERHTCVLGRVGDVWCWGADQFVDPLTGGPITATRPRPVLAESGAALPPMTAITASGDHTCALDASGGVWCWGANDVGQLGRGTLSVFGGPARAGLGLSAMTSITAGIDVTCAVRNLGRPGVSYCWGANRFGILGDGRTVDSSLPVEVRHLTDGIALGARHACASAARRVTCWGDNSVGQFGDGSVDPSLDGRDITALAGAVGLSTATTTTCVVRSDASLWCTGDDSDGQLGNGLAADGSFVERPVVAVGVKARAVEMGWRHGCVIGLDGRPRCWGDNRSGQLGDGTQRSRSTPRVVRGL